MARPKRIFIVGAGRLGGALALALKQAGHPVATVNRTLRAEKKARKRGVPGRTFEVGEADVVLLTVPDAQIGEVAEVYGPFLSKRQVLAHCSGALGLEPLERAAITGAHVGSVHPLCAVPSPETNLAGAAAAVDGDARAIRTLTLLAKEVGLVPFRLDAKNRALYHAAAALASNGLVGLAANAVVLLEQCGLEKKKAIAAFVPLMASALEGVRARGLPDALTGPVARGDVAVVEKHLAALAGSTQAGELYRALARALVPLANQLGTGDSQGKKAIAKLVR